MHSLLQCSLLWTIFQRGPRRSGRTYQTQFHTHQEGVHIKNQVKPWLLRPILDPHHYHISSKLNWQPISLLLQLVKIIVHFQTRTSSLRSVTCILYWSWCTFSPLFRAQIPEMRYSSSSRCKCILSQLICIYGYSFGCFILVFLLCIIPVSWLHWLLMIYGMINSSAFLILNLREYL